MALLMLIHLSLLLHTCLPGNIQLPSSFSQSDQIDCPASCTTDKWNWTVNCFRTSDILEVMVQTLDHCTQEKSSDCLSMTVKKEPDTMKPSDNLNCRSNSQLLNTQSQCDKNVTGHNCIDFEPGEKICISLKKNGKVRMKFNCTQQPPAEICNYTNMQFHSEKKSWIDALEYCQEMNSSLLEITNQSQDCIKNQFSQNNSDSQAWIGLERSIFGNNPKWQWISGSEVNYTNWNSSFPVNPSNNHCGKVFVNERKEIKWLDANCHEQLPFICQSLNSSRYPTEAPTLKAALCINTGNDCNDT